MFQRQVYVNPAQAVPGVFASSNPMVYKLSSTGLMIADASGVQVGKFAVLNPDGTVTSMPGAAPDTPSRIGFVHRENNAQIIKYLAESGYTIQRGEPVALFGTGDFYVEANKVNGTVKRGAKILWDTVTGDTQIGGAASGSIVDTGWELVSETAAVGAYVIISNTNA